jgi:hypothetical protein
MATQTQFNSEESDEVEFDCREAAVAYHHRVYPSLEEGETTLVLAVLPSHYHKHSNVAKNL